MKDSLSTIYKSAAHFLTGTAISRLTGLLRDISLAFAFGATPEVAALLVAFRLSHLARRLLGEGALQQAFIPLFEEIRKEDEKQALSFFRTLSLSLSILLIFLIAICSVILIFLNPYFSNDGQEIIILTLFMLPSLLFICLYGLNASFLQCENRYFAPAIAPVAFNLVWVLGAYLSRDFPQNEAMRWMTLAINLACIGQWLTTIPFLYKNLKGISLLPRWFSKELQNLIKRMGLGVIGVAAVQVNNAIDPLFARFADLSGPAWLWYAIRIQQFPLAIFAIALSSALLPPLSRAIRRKDQEQFQTFLEHALKKSAGLMIPLSLLMIAVSRHLVTLVFGYGEFDMESIEMTSKCLSAYLLGLAPSTFILIFASAFFSQNNYRTPAIGSVITMLSNMVFNSFFIFIFGLGSISVALSTSLSAMINAIYLRRYLNSSFHFFSLSKTLLASMLAFIAASYAAPNFSYSILELILTTSIFLVVLIISGSILNARDLLFWQTKTVKELVH